MADFTSVREKTVLSNTLVCLLKGIEGKSTTVELRNESTVYGRIDSVDRMMNIQLSNAKFTTLQGKEARFENFFVQGKNIRFVQIPNEVNMLRTIKNEVGMFHKTKKPQSGNRKIPGKKSRMKKFYKLSDTKASAGSKD